MRRVKAQSDSMSKILTFGLALLKYSTAKKTIARIFCHNADGISNDRLALQELLHSLDIDIVLICETELPTVFG